MPITITIPDQIFPDWLFWVMVGIVILNLIVFIYIEAREREDYKKISSEIEWIA